MPKVIENIQAEFIKVGKEILLKDGYKTLTIRKVALNCGVGLGTIYNYFKSKDELVANIMIIDWLKIHDEAKKKCLKENNKDKGIEIIYKAIRKFSNQYRFVWNECDGIASITSSRHEMLIKQIKELLIIYLSDDNKAEFMAEVLLVYGIRPKDEYLKIKNQIDVLIK